MTENVFNKKKLKPEPNLEGIQVKMHQSLSHRNQVQDCNKTRNSFKKNIDNSISFENRPSHKGKSSLKTQDKKVSLKNWVL